MDRDVAMASEKTRMLFNRTIEALLLECSARERSSEADAWIRRLENYRNEVPAELSEIKDIADILASAEGRLTPELELDLTDRLVTLYVDISGGALIF